MSRTDLEDEVEQARTCASIIRLLAGDEIAGPPHLRQSFYAYLGDRLDAHFEVIQSEIESLWTEPEPGPPPMPPKTAEEVAFSAEVAATLSDAADRLRQRNLNRAVSLAREAAEGTGPLVDHFAELGRRFGREAAV